MIKRYKAIYRDKVVEVQAETSVGAQVLAVEMFKAEKGYDIAVLSGKKWKEVQGQVR